MNEAEKKKYLIGGNILRIIERLGRRDPQARKGARLVVELNEHNQTGIKITLPSGEEVAIGYGPELKDGLSQLANFIEENNI